MPGWLRSTYLTKTGRLGIRPHSAVSNPSTGMKVTDGNMHIDMFVREGGTDREVAGDGFMCSRETTPPHKSQVVTAYTTGDQSQKIKHLPHIKWQKHLNLHYFKPHRTFLLCIKERDMN